jgi:serine/threonine-protein kinase
MIGETIREFEILSELGSGGYGVVYRAHDTSVDRDVAIKVILPQYANKPEFIATFEVEARLVAQLAGCRN